MIMKGIKMYTVLIMVTITISVNTVDLQYRYDGTMEDCYNTTVRLKAYDTLANNNDKVYKYLCVDVSELYSDEEEA